MYIVVKTWHDKDPKESRVEILLGDNYEVYQIKKKWIEEKLYFSGIFDDKAINFVHDRIEKNEDEDSNYVNWDWKQEMKYCTYFWNENEFIIDGKNNYSLKNKFIIDDKELIITLDELTFFDSDYHQLLIKKI